MDPDQIQGTSVESPSEPTQPTADDTQPEAMPTSNQQSTEQEPVAASDQDDDSLPEEVSERTRKQFEKLKEENRKLKEQTKSTQPQPEYGTSVFDTLRPSQPPTTQASYLNQAQIESIQSQFVDGDGNVDVNGLNRALREANDRAYLSLQEVQTLQERITRMEENQQVKEAHIAFPELDPLKKDSFDPKFFNLVRDRIAVSSLQGQPITLLEAASQIREVYSSPRPVNVAKVKEEAIAEYKETQQLRNQGPVETGKGQPRQTISDIEDLRRRTRIPGEQGDMALMERIKLATEGRKTS